MLKRLLALLSRDLLAARRDSLMLYIMVVPIILAVVITLAAPGLNDTSVVFAMLEDDEKSHLQFMERYAKVERFESVEQLERRVLKRDEVTGFLLQPDGSYTIIAQGNESEFVIEAARTYNALYELGSTPEETTAQMLDFGLSVPPLKTKLVNMLILMTVMLSGMLIALGIVEEKQSDTISAINVTPVSQNEFILGKSLIGGMTTLLGIVIAVLITGYVTINWVMILLVGFMSMLLSLVIGFLQGLNSDDIIEAAAGVKMLLLPIAGSIAGYEFLSGKWQWTMYWSPFYWSYKANEQILSGSATWPEVLLYAGLVFALSMVIYLLFMPRIRKGLS